MANALVRGVAREHHDADAVPLAKINKCFFRSCLDRVADGPQARVRSIQRGERHRRAGSAHGLSAIGDIEGNPDAFSGEQFG